MPFLFYREVIKGIQSSSKVLHPRNIQLIDRIVVERVFPQIEWVASGGNIARSTTQHFAILPNGLPLLFGEGSTSYHHADVLEPRKYFALLCMEQGLALGDIGLWLDYFSANFGATHIDGRSRQVVPCVEKIHRFDCRKKIYFNPNQLVPCRRLVIQE